MSCDQFDKEFVNDQTNVSLLVLIFNETYQKVGDSSPLVSVISPGEQFPLVA